MVKWLKFSALLVVAMIFFTPAEELGGPADPYLLSYVAFITWNRGAGGGGWRGILWEGDAPDEIGGYKFRRFWVMFEVD